MDGPTPSESSIATTLFATGKRAKDAFVYSSAYLAVITMIEVALASVALSVPFTPAVAVGGLVTFAIYAHDRVADADTDAVSNPDQAAFVRRHQNVLYNLASAAYGLAVAVSILGGPLALATTLMPGVFALLYSTDVLGGLGTPVKRLKDVLLVNTVVVSLAWAVLLTFLPLAFADAAFSPAVAVVFAYFFLATFVNVEIPNVRDIEGDIAIGVRTLPTVLGVSRTRKLLYAVNLVMAGLVAFALVSGFFVTGIVAAFLVSLAYTIGVTAFLGRTTDDGRLTAYAEFKSIVAAAALVVVAL
ncbi:UbiA family prenyltransferase [Halocalculus aciditolerans]|uniref:UbiA family prenyltransferase n=1 Tax=Halocalculus aciditolerans TaxID=1383812 RepID=UPI001E3D4D83|nr:UbiA family prenyltransferase [Halocalculus aciditolerans]